ncbi:hypothetical protein [Vitiosangium sp. GDMCC 1.1324]|uniref:hypothetical protein n=1 Tax=Vitiosangium sp. (strain GDMCC 1.1324) TaxID=2138576 RepID=UPI000D3B484E|nr:hypothetical protein [Vitiosangium sp. GDMCC 1.1324]PTL78963.1 hypothetical protein DAT35_35665 [Vitiosangium sp. GDMCC 1.1324]
MSTIYSLTSKLYRVIANNPSVTTLNFTNNIEIDTTEQASSPGFGTRMFLANLSSNTLVAMAQLADTALAVGGQTTIQYQVVTSGTSPSGNPTYVAQIVSFAYNGKVIEAT